MVLKGARVLLVEDTADVRDAFVTLLRGEGAEVTAAATGRQALECSARGAFDIVLTDLGLPDVPGELIIREIVATSRPRPRIVAVTGYGEPHVSRARAAGAAAVFAKPVEWSALLRELRPAAAAAVA
ncbi:MAG: response regulator [Candidatus Rokuibacteriota bacterium]